jgi:hypothetical protein
MIEKYYNKERKYNKISQESIKASRKNIGGHTKFAPDYMNMTWQQRIRKSALKASDNGRCWWIHDYIIKTTVSPGTNI